MMQRMRAAVHHIEVVRREKRREVFYRNAGLEEKPLVHDAHDGAKSLYALIDEIRVGVSPVRMRAK